MAHPPPMRPPAARPLTAVPLGECPAAHSFHGPQVFLPADRRAAARLQRRRQVPIQLGPLLALYSGLRSA